MEMHPDDFPSLSWRNACARGPLCLGIRTKVFTCANAGAHRLLRVACTCASVCCVYAYARLSSPTSAFCLLSSSLSLCSVSLLVVPWYTRYLLFTLSSLALARCLNAYSAFLRPCSTFYLSVAALLCSPSEPQHWSINERSLHKTFCTLRPHYVSHHLYFPSSPRPTEKEPSCEEEDTGKPD